MYFSYIEAFKNEDTVKTTFLSACVQHMRTLHHDSFYWFHLIFKCITDPCTLNAIDHMDIMDGLVYHLGENSMYFEKCKYKKEKPE